MSIRDILAQHRRDRIEEDKKTRTGRSEVARILEKNICTIADLREAREKEKTTQDRAADLITNFSGSMWFVYVHIIWFGLWMLINLKFTPLKPFDPYPFNFLTMVVSLEAIFLSTFVLISQNKLGKLADERAELDLQINLLAEYEITRILRLVDAMADQMGIDEASDPEIDELKSAVAPDVVLQEIKAREEEGK